MVDYTEMNRLLYDGKVQEFKARVEQALAEGHNPSDILQQGLISGMHVVGTEGSSFEVSVEGCRFKPVGPRGPADLQQPFNNRLVQANES
jgi:hypothetical protein